MLTYHCFFSLQFASSCNERINFLWWILWYFCMLRSLSNQIKIWILNLWKNKRSKTNFLFHRCVPYRVLQFCSMKYVASGAHLKGVGGGWTPTLERPYNMHMCPPSAVKVPLQCALFWQLCLRLQKVPINLAFFNIVSSALKKS